MKYSLKSSRQRRGSGRGDSSVCLAKERFYLDCVIVVYVLRPPAPAGPWRASGDKSNIVSREETEVMIRKISKGKKDVLKPASGGRLAVASGRRLKISLLLQFTVSTIDVPWVCACLS